MTEEPRRSPKSGVKEGSIEERPEGFVVKHPDDTESSYTIHNPNEPLPSSVDQIDEHKRERDEQGNPKDVAPEEADNQ